MFRNVVETMLLITLVLGTIMAVVTGRERSRLEAEHRRLASLVGDLNIKDGSKVHVQALETGEPLHFAWRFYAPGHVDLVSRHGGSQGWTTFDEPTDSVVRIRFKSEADGSLGLYQKYGSGSSWSSFDDDPIGVLIRDHPDWLRVEQLGRDGVAILDPKKPATLLRLRMAPEMEAGARKAIDPDRLKPYLAELYSLEIEPEKPPQP